MRYNDTGTEKTLQEQSYMDIITSIEATATFSILLGGIIGLILAYAVKNKNFTGYAKYFFAYALMGLVASKVTLSVMKAIGK